MLACVERVPPADTVASLRQLMRACLARRIQALLRRAGRPSHRPQISERNAELGACMLVCVLGARYFGQRDLLQ